MIKIIIGKGIGKDATGLKKYTLPFGTLKATLKEKHKKKTFEEVGKAIAKQMKIKDGEIVILSLEFSYSKEIASA